MWEVYIFIGLIVGVYLIMLMVEVVGMVQLEYEGSVWVMKSDVDFLQFLDYDDVVKMEIVYLNVVCFCGGFNEQMWKFLLYIKMFCLWVLWVRCFVQLLVL